MYNKKKKRGVNLEKINLQKIWSFFILTLLSLSFYYYSYRYPLKINSSDTSPTYSDTPTVLSAGKYALFSLLFYLTILVLLKLKPKTVLYKNKLPEVFISLVLSIFPIVQFILYRNQWALEIGIFFTILVLYYFFPVKELNYKSISKSITIFTIIAILVELYQVANFYINGRLPALAYEDTISVRFGSLWDDPNGFGLIISFLVPFVWKVNIKMIYKIILLISLFISLLLTQSITAILATFGAFVIGLIFMFLIEKKTKHIKTFFITGFLAMLLILCFKAFIEPSVFYQEFMHHKQGSIEGHANGFLALSNVGLSHLLGFNDDPRGQYAETGYINLLLNLGIFYFLFYLWIGFTTIVRLANFIKNNRNKKCIEVFFGAYFFVITFYIALLNLPIETVFPLNLILVICMILSYSNDLKEEKETKVRKRYRLTW